VAAGGWVAAGAAVVAGPPQAVKSSVTTMITASKWANLFMFDSSCG
jgi:hypothetical protein